MKTKRFDSESSIEKMPEFDTERDEDEIIMRNYMTE